MAKDRPKWLTDLSAGFKRHRQGRAGWMVEVHRERLRVSSSELPPRPGELLEPPRRRSVTLTTPPGPAGFNDALQEACALFDAVMAGTWRWPDPMAPAAHEASRLAPITLARLRQRLQQSTVGERISQRTWDKTYLPYLLKLEQVAGQQAWPEDADLLTAALRHWQPNSRARQMAHDRMRALWKVASWSWPEQITTMRGNGKAAADPAGVIGFKDAEIEALRHRIQRSRLTPADLVAWDCLIVFGLRPAELKGLELQQQGAALVALVAHEKKNSRGKVGARTVPAVPPAGWPADCYGLLQRWGSYGLPPALVALPSPGEGMAQQLDRLQRQKGAEGDLRSQLTPYGLRHAFALRLGVDLALSVREAAELMGHSPAVHLSTYGRRLDQPKLLARVQALQASLRHPAPP
jgi:integrase